MTTNCPVCGADTEPGATRCASCLTPVRGFAVERRHATVLFADLCGSTAFAEHRDPEEVHAVVDRCLVAMCDIVSQHGGTVTRVIGDELMAVFGVPSAHGDDAERAVRTAVALAGTDLGGLPVRVGVNTGDLFVAPLGAGEARRFSVTGSTVNLAARLREHAAESGVRVGEETRRTTRHVVDYAQVAPLRAKGIDEPVAAWEPVTVALAPGRPLSQSPFVGRHTERERLRETWQQVRGSGRPGLVTVVGQPGIGKSRLVAEFLADVTAGNSARVAHGRCLPYGRPTPYDAVAALLCSLADVPPGADDVQTRERFDHWLAGRAHGRDASHLRLLAGVAREADSAVDLQSLVASMARVLQTIDRPAVLVIDDLHWSSASQLTLLQFVLQRLRGTLLVVALARPELADRASEWGARVAGAVGIDLEPLDGDESQRLADALLASVPPDGAPPAGDRAVAVAGEAGGVPLFLEELVAEMRERRRPGQPLPGSIQDVLSARLDLLPQEIRSTIMVAAVLGREFAVSTLTALQGRRVEDDLVLLGTRGFVRPQASGRFRFCHDLIRDVAYHTLPLAERSVLHQRVARHLEHHPETPGSSPEVLAHHWLMAGDDERAVEQLLAAAGVARRAWAKEDALRWYDDVASLLPEEDARLDDIQLRRGLTLVECGDYPGALVVLEEVMPRLRGEPRAEALLGMCTSAFWTMDTTRSQRLAEEAVQLAGTDHALRVRAEAIRSVSLSMRETRTRTGIRESEEALSCWPEDAPPTELVNLLGALGGFHYWVGDYGDAIRRAREGYRLGSQLHDVNGTLIAASHLGLGLVGSGRHEEALALYREVAALGREHELVPRFTARILSMWGGALRELGDVTGARERAAEAIETARSAQFPPPVVEGRIDLLCLDLLEGRIGDAARDWPALQEAATAMRGWHNWLTLGRLAVARAEIALGRSDFDGALEASVAAEGYARRTHRRKYVVAARQVRGRALLALGRAGDAVAVLGPTLGTAVELGHPAAHWQVEGSLAEALRGAGRDTEAAEHDTAARSTHAAFAATLSEEHRRLLLDSPVAQPGG